jgi:hypothetical protein
MIKIIIIKIMIIINTILIFFGNKIKFLNIYFISILIPSRFLLGISLFFNYQFFRKLLFQVFNFELLSFR